ncbi:hypothetical protein G6F57_019569 [Rhizopus arrhizus]|nr:hypothetical protein G6F57_019569 [Rhizopus arrhizus]
MAVVAALLQVFGDGALRRAGGGQGGGQLQPLHALRVAAGGGPADAVAGGQAFRERRAVQHQPLLVVGLGGHRSCGAEIQFAVDVVFDQRDVVARQQFDQLPLLVVGHQAAQRVLELRHQPARFGRMPLDGGLHRVQVDAGARMGGTWALPR